MVQGFRPVVCTYIALIVRSVTIMFLKTFSFKVEEKLLTESFFDNSYILRKLCVIINR